MSDLPRCGIGIPGSGWRGCRTVGDLPSGLPPGIVRVALVTSRSVIPGKLPCKATTTLRALSSLALSPKPTMYSLIALALLLLSVPPASTASTASSTASTASTIGAGTLAPIRRTASDSSPTLSSIWARASAICSLKPLLSRRSIASSAPSGVSSV